MKHVVVDPITRIEGHLRVEVSVDEGSGKVTDALSSGTECGPLCTVQFTGLKMVQPYKVIKRGR